MQPFFIFSFECAWLPGGEFCRRHGGHVGDERPAALHDLQVVDVARTSASC